MENAKGLESKDGLMEQFMKENLKMIKLMEKVSLFILMEIIMRGIGSTIKLKVSEGIQGILEVIIKEDG